MSAYFIQMRQCKPAGSAAGVEITLLDPQDKPCLSVNARSAEEAHRVSAELVLLLHRLKPQAPIVYNSALRISA